MNWKKFILLSCVLPCVFAVSTATAQMRGPHRASMARMPMRGAPMRGSMARMPMQRGPMLNSAFGFHRFNDGDSLTGMIVFAVSIVSMTLIGMIVFVASIVSMTLIGMIVFVAFTTTTISTTSLFSITSVFRSFRRSFRSRLLHSLHSNYLLQPVSVWRLLPPTRIRCLSGRL